MGKISEDDFIKLYNKYNTIETDYTNDFIDDMKVYVKYDNKFTPDPKDFIDYKDIIENRPAYADKEKYNSYHEELRLQIELEKRLKREAEEEAKRKFEEEQRLKEEAMRAEEENKESEGNNTGRGKKDKRKKKEEEERKRKEEERKKKEEEEKKKKEEEERKRKEEEEKNKKEEEEKLKIESCGRGENNVENTQSVEKDEEQEHEEEQQKIIKYKRIYFKCYSDFDIPYDKFKNELLIESFKEDNFQLIINPYFTFFGETLINKIKNYEAPLLPEREEPLIEDEMEEELQMIISSSDNNANLKDKNNPISKNADNFKDKKDKNIKIAEPNDVNGVNPENIKKDTPMNTATSNLSGKKDEKKPESKNQPQIQQPLGQNPPLIKNSKESLPEGKIGGPTKSTKPNTYRPNIIEDKLQKDELIIKDYGRLPSLRVIQFGGNDLRFYQEYIPPYQLKEHILNDTNLFNFSDDCDIIGQEIVVNMIQMINEIDGFATYKVLPYNNTDWKKYNSNIIKILPNKLKDIKNEEYPLVTKINQQINKYKRNLFENNFKDDDNDKKNLELIIHNEDFDQCFSLPEFFTLDIYKKNNIPHLIKTFSKGTFIYVNLKFAINKMCEILEINNQTGYGFCLIVCKKFIFMAPIKEPFTYTKLQEENKEKNAKTLSSIPLFIEPYYFMGIYTLPYIESEWPESITRKNVKFDLLDILKKSTN